MSTKPLRKDAEVNRLRLLKAASELFAERGYEITLNDIAHRAGVGVGTAYRRYANKDEIFLELFHQRTVESQQILETALADPDPWHGLVYFLEESMREQHANRGMRQLMANPALAPEHFDERKDRIAPMVNALAARAVATGVVRPEITGTDLVFIQSAIGAIMDMSRDFEPQLYKRYLTFLLDGISAEPTRTPLPVEALSTDTTHASVMSQRPV